MDRGLFVDLADKMANAVQNLQPKLNIWTTGTAGVGSAALPLFAGTVKLFSWLPDSPACLPSITTVENPG